MSRTRELVREGQYTRDGRLLLPGAVTWREEIPLLDRTENPDDFGHLVGVVSNIRRDEHRILGDLSIDVADDVIVTCDVDSIEKDDDYDGAFRAARLIGAYLNTRDQWPWEDQ